MCLGDTPETAFQAYRHDPAVLGHASTVDYVHEACEMALAAGFSRTPMPGVISRDEMTRLRPVNVSLGLMLETEPAVARAGMPHHHAPDKDPTRVRR